MDIHRCRFVDWSPQPINVLAFSHTSRSEARNQPVKLAIGRANGDIEIWDPRKGLWIHEKTLYGGRDRSVDGLAWVHDPDDSDDNGFVNVGRSRLFSIGYSNSVTEWNLISGLPLQQSSGNLSEIWCIASQPPTISKHKNKSLLNSSAGNETFQGQNLAVGCADGSMVLLSTADDSLNFKSFIGRAHKKKARVLSIAWQNRNLVVAGFADSTIRIHNAHSGENIRTIMVGGGPKGGPRESLIWAVLCLEDGTIVSGDSTGEVAFWDGKNYTHLQRIKAHEADTLCLSASEDGKTLMSSGMDRRTVIYEREIRGKRIIWHRKTHRRLHQHDVKAMARFDSKKMNFIVSGGTDATPIIVPLREFELEHHRTLPLTPQNPPIRGGQRTIVNFSCQDLSLWRVNTRDEQTFLHDKAAETPEYTLLARLNMKDDENIQCVDLSSDGSLLVVGTAAQTKFFHIRHSYTSSRKPALKIRKLDTPKIFATLGSRILKLSPDMRWLVMVDRKNSIQLARVSASDLKKPQILATLLTLKRQRRKSSSPQNCFNGAWGSYDSTITRVAFSDGSKILVSSDIAGYCDTFVLRGKEDLTASPVHKTFPEGRHYSDSESSSDGSSNFDSDKASSQTQKKHRLIYGQHWPRLAASQQIPSLNTSALILSFRPACTSRQPSVANTNGKSNPSPHQNSHQPFSIATEDRILILTATHEFLEFHALTGRLTEWSRRNSTALLPDEFKLQRDRAACCIWDTTDPSRTRAWLSSSSWVAMFDLSQDLPAPSPPLSKPSTTQKALTNGVSASTPDLADPEANKDVITKTDYTSAQLAKFSAKRAAKKRKRALLSKRHTTGAAGSRVENTDERNPRKVRRVNEDGTRVWVEVPRNGTGESDSEDGDGENQDERDEKEDEDENEKAALALARRNDVVESESDSNSDSEAEGEPEVEADPLSRDDPQKQSLTTKKPVPFYLTTHYRHILGMVALTSPSPSLQGGESGAADALAEGDEPPQHRFEVAIIERPPWDLDLPPRFEGAKERRGER